MNTNDNNNIIQISQYQKTNSLIDYPSNVIKLSEISHGRSAVVASVPEVIHVNFQQQRKYPQYCDIAYKPNLEEYASYLRDNNIDNDDILDIIDAIQNVDAFSNADEDIQLFAAYWFGI